MKEFIGFSNIISSFKKRVDNNTLSHAHLIIGPEGIGKSIMARIFALKILGKDADYNYVDIIHYRPEKASFGVDEVRKIIQEVAKRPYEEDKKVIIIHQGSKLTVQAQNALLKTIEEPPLGVYIILLSESVELLLDTIKSRCQIYKLTPLNKEDMIKYIKALGEKDKEKILVALSYGEGIPGRAERMLKDEELHVLRNLIIELFDEMNKKSSNTVINYDKKFLKYKNEKEEVLRVISSFIRDIIVYKELRDKDRIINVDMVNKISELSKFLSYNKLNAMLGHVEEGKTNFENNISYSMTISVMLIGFLEG